MNKFLKDYETNYLKEQSLTKIQNLKIIEQQFKEIEKNIKIDMKKILSSQKSINIILTATSLGKSLGFAIWICKQILTDENKVFIWVRRWEAEIKETVVGMFKELLGDQGRVTIGGVYLHGKKVVYFIPLSQYHKYKSLTGIANKLQAIIFDEAIPVNKKWLNDTYTTEKEKFSKLTNVLARNKKSLPFYFLCNPEAKGAWMIQEYFPHYQPSEQREKTESKGIAFVYSMPWPEEEERGIIDKLETEETKRITKQGLYAKSEDDFITNDKATKYIYSFVIAGQEMDFGKRGNYFIISTANLERKNKKLIIFRRPDLIKYDKAILGDKQWYGDWWYTLLAARKVKFNNHSLRDHFFEKTSMDFRW